jgi:hypothetical protein
VPVALARREGVDCFTSASGSAQWDRTRGMVSGLSVLTGVATFIQAEPYSVDRMVRSQESRCQAAKAAAPEDPRRQASQKCVVGQFDSGTGSSCEPTRPEGASDARRTWVYVERRWRPRTKYGEANWPSTGLRAGLSVQTGCVTLAPYR